KDSPLPSPPPPPPPDSETRSIQIEFPHYAAVLLESLNKHRLEGKFCDISIHVQGRVFQAHKSVLAASSPYFHDKLLLNDTNCIVLPSVIEPEAFENLLQLIYSGRLKLLMEALPSHLLVASGLQMWQVVDQCSEILKELEGGPCRPWSSRASESQSPSSSNYFAVKDDGEPGGSSSEGPGHGGVSSGRAASGCLDNEVVKIRVSQEEEEEEEEEEDHQAQICSGSMDKAVKIVLEEDEEGGGRGGSKGLSSGELDSAFHGPRDHPKIFYIKQERFDPDEAAVGGLCQAEFQPSKAGFPQSSWKPVDLHGNEIIAHAVHGQVVHAPVKIVTAPDGKKFGCLCGKRFAVKPKRDRHIMLTFSLRPFGCSVCNKKFKLKHHLTEHMKTHDGNLYSCEDCGRKFRVQNCFLKHKELCKGQGWATACWTYK
uniref:Zinc finger and BTB domain containing 9 n=1 Tax=Chelonoidis abingdonii TaxID=106734 RepID=A0A8C0IJN2_CHEAB